MNMTHHLEIETPDTVRRAQWAELDQAIFNVDCYLIHFAGDPEKLAIALDRGYGYCGLMISTPHVT